MIAEQNGLFFIIPSACFTIVSGRIHHCEPQQPVMPMFLRRFFGEPTNSCFMPELIYAMPPGMYLKSL